MGGWAVAVGKAEGCWDGSAPGFGVVGLDHGFGLDHAEVSEVYWRLESECGELHGLEERR